MTRYDQLRNAFREYNDAEIKFVDENVRFAAMVVNGFRDYLETPENFQRTTGVSIVKQNYTPFYRIDESDNLVEEEILINAIRHLSDGSFDFGFGLVLERKHNAFPKRNLLFRVKCKRKGNMIEVDTSGKSIEIAYDGNHCNDIHKIHEQIYDQAIEWLKHRPGDGLGEIKIGFV